MDITNPLHPLNPLNPASPVNPANADGGSSSVTVGELFAVVYILGMLLVLAMFIFWLVADLDPTPLMWSDILRVTLWPLAGAWFLIGCQREALAKKRELGLLAREALAKKRTSDHEAALRIKAAAARCNLRPPTPPEPDRKPFNCPICSGRIERDGDTWHCRGLANREEVEMYLAPEHHGLVPPQVIARPPCGWSGAHATFGKEWA